MVYRACFVLILYKQDASWCWSWGQKGLVLIDLIHEVSISHESWDTVQCSQSSRDILNKAKEKTSIL